MSRRRRTAAYTAAAAAAMSDGPLGFSQRIALLPRLVRDTLSGRYDGMTTGRLALMAAAVLYILLPIDLAPEALLSIPGLLDDAAIGAWLIAALIGATTAYRAWASGSAPSGSAPSGSAPSGSAPSGSAPSGSAPSGAATSSENVRGGRHRVIPGEVLTS